MELIVAKSAFAGLEKLTLTIQQRIIQKLRFYINQKNPLAYAERLKDFSLGQWRFRIGDYRAVFDVDENKIIILKIGHRKNIYK